MTPLVRQSVIKVPSEQFKSAQAVAKSLRLTVYEPTWWPEDVGTLTYQIQEFTSGSYYRIGSVRSDGTPISVLGGRRSDQARLPPEHWYALPELQSWSGLVSETETHCRAVLQKDEQTIQLIGFESVGEIVRAADSLRRVGMEL